MVREAITFIFVLFSLPMGQLLFDTRMLDGGRKILIVAVFYIMLIFAAKGMSDFLRRWFN